MKTVILPARNIKDLVDVPKRAKSELRIVPVEHLDQVLEVALAPLPEKPKTIRTKRKAASPVAETGKTQPPAEVASQPIGDTPPVQPV